MKRLLSYKSCDVTRKKRYSARRTKNEHRLIATIYFLLSLANILAKFIVVLYETQSVDVFLPNFSPSPRFPAASTAPALGSGQCSF